MERVQQIILESLRSLPNIKLCQSIRARNIVICIKGKKMELALLKNSNINKVLEFLF